MQTRYCLKQNPSGSKCDTKMVSFPKYCFKQKGRKIELLLCLIKEQGQ